MRYYSKLIVLPVLISLALSSGCSSSPEKPSQPEVSVTVLGPTAPRLPVELRTPARTDYDLRIESSLANYYRSLAMRNKLPKSGIGLRPGT